LVFYCRAVVEVRARRIARRTDRAYYVAGLHRFAGDNENFVQVVIVSEEPHAVVDDDRVARNEKFFREGDSASRGGLYFRARGRRDVEGGVAVAEHAVGVALLSEVCGDAAFCGLDKHSVKKQMRRGFKNGGLAPQPVMQRIFGREQRCHLRGGSQVLPRKIYGLHVIGHFEKHAAFAVKNFFDVQIVRTRRRPRCDGNYRGKPAFN